MAIVDRMEVSEQAELEPHRLFRASETVAADALLVLGPNPEVAEVSSVVQAVRSPSVSNVWRNEVQFEEIPDGIRLCRQHQKA